MSGPTTWCYLDKAPAMQHRMGCATDGLLSSALFLAPPVLPSVVMAIMVPAGQGLGSGSYYRTRAADAQRIRACEAAEVSQAGAALPWC